MCRRWNGSLVGRKSFVKDAIEEEAFDYLCVGQRGMGKMGKLGDGRNLAHVERFLACTAVESAKRKRRSRNQM